MPACSSFTHKFKRIKMDIDTSLRDCVLKLLKQTDKTLREIQKDTGLKEDWLTKLNQGLIDDPSVNKIQTLYNYLSGKELKL